MRTFALWMIASMLATWVVWLTLLVLTSFIGRADATMVNDETAVSTTTTTVPPSEEIVPPTGGDTGPDEPLGAQ